MCETGFGRQVSTLCISDRDRYTLLTFLFSFSAQTLTPVVITPVRGYLVN